MRCLGIRSLKQKRLESLRGDLKTILRSQNGMVFLNSLRSFVLVCKETVPRYGKTISSCFLGTVIASITLLRYFFIKKLFDTPVDDF